MKEKNKSTGGRSFYSRLALEGIRKNKRLYIPYILTGCIMVMMYYILGYLTESPALGNMPGGSVLMMLLPFGCGVITIFSVLFLFYSNSFLIKQRYREFGLYNILGMDKFNIGKVMFLENLFTAVLAIMSGIFTGVVLSKAAELILLNMLNMEISFQFSVGITALGNTVLIYSAIYFLLLINSLIKVWRSKPLELMQSSKTGEKFKKRTWILALLGIVCLIVAYYLAVTIQEPVTALMIFFQAVILVIIGTYLIFISGSVALCKLLQKNKKYYYKPNHFVSVSSMSYRMKRNGAGLASICILLTMVLVMIASTASLYFGEESSIRNRYPSDININVLYNTIDCINDEKLDVLREKISQIAPENVDITGFRNCEIPGMFTDTGIMIDIENATGLSEFSYDKLGVLSVVLLDDYNKMMGTNKTLADDECFIYSDRISTKWDTFTMEYGKTYKVKEHLKEYKVEGDALVMTIPCVYVVVNDLYSFAEPVKGMANFNGDPLMLYEWNCGFDMDSVDEELEARDKIKEILLQEYNDGNSLVNHFYVHSREAQRYSFYEMYGSLFFIGIMLSIVFLLAAVLIIYYKQISEGYEDQNRFEIMQKVGMTNQDIRKSINSQLLTVFFMPLLMAGIHLAFAYPFISKILLMFAFNDTVLNIAVNIMCFVVFGILYAIVYKITSNGYYSIVSGMKEK